jgi:hypothetical protein
MTPFLDLSQPSEHIQLLRQAIKQVQSLDDVSPADRKASLQRLMDRLLDAQASARRLRAGALNGPR